MDITAHLGPDCYSGVIFLSSTPCHSWDWKASESLWIDIFPLIVSRHKLDQENAAKALVGGFTHKGTSEETNRAWIETYESQHPFRRVEKPAILTDAAKNTPVLVLLGKDDKILSWESLGEKYKEEFTSVEVQVWPEVGHLPCFEEPEKTRDAILEFVERVINVQLSSALPFYEKPEKTRDAILASAERVINMRLSSALPFYEEPKAEEG